MKEGRSFFIETYGCEMNKSDSIDVALSLEEHGYKRASSIEEADLIILNTCSVREHAVERIIGRLGFFRSLSLKADGEIVIVLTGCVAQEQGRRLMELFPEIKVIAGTYHFLDIPRLIERYERSGIPVIADDMEEYFFSTYRGMRAEGHRAWVNIITGCSNYCSYCIVPYLRGKEISKSSSEVLREISELVQRGVVEITLLGHNVNAYGIDSGDISFVELLERINEIDGLRWIRFLTSHPRDFNPELVKRISRLPKVCRHFHLPLQSGSDRILALMNRKYTLSHFRSVVDAIREFMLDAAITTDIIVGFPAETEEDFEQTLKAVESIEFDDAFTYRYSKRPFTRAATFEDQVPSEVAAKRLTELISLQRAISLKKNLEEVGKHVTLLVERMSKKSSSEFLCRSEKNKVVVVPTKKPSGSFIEAKIVEISGNTLRGVELELKGGKKPSDVKPPGVVSCI